jgi:hypothetical protein
MPQITQRKAPVKLQTASDQDHSVQEQFEESAQARDAQDARTITSWRLLAIGAMALNSFLLFAVLITQFIAASKPVSPFVTRGNGEIESLEYIAGNERPPALITNFARTSMGGIFTWRNTLPLDGNPPDPGMTVGKGGTKISTTSYRYTFALSTGFAEVFREKLAEIVKDLTTGNAETVYIPTNVSKPVQISAGLWTVDIVGDLYIQGGTVNRRVIPLSRKLTIRAVPPITLSEATQKYKEPGLANSVARIRAAGLEITNIDKIIR